MGEKLVVYLLSRHVQEELGHRTLDPLLTLLSPFLRKTENV